MKRGLYGSARGERGVKRTPFHILLDAKQRKKLEALSREMKLSGAQVFRKLLEAA